MPQPCYALRTRLGMPKKSKKEKILADRRRLTQVEHIQPLPPPFQFPLNNTTSVVPKNESGQSTNELSAVKRDLTKTFILAVLAIAAEVAIYWFGRGNI